jgi:uncharacterized delta-60 repeat protein
VKKETFNPSQSDTNLMKRCFQIALLTCLGPASALRAAPGDVDLAFDTGRSGGGFTPGIVRALAAQPDGKVIVGGGVKEIGTTEVNGIARLNADGTVDSTFNSGTGTDGSIVSIVLQSDGKALVGGWFTTINGTSRHGIARLNTDGGLDNTFDAGTGGKRGFSVGRVWSVALQPDSKVLVGGAFTTFNGTTRNLIARLNEDGSVDSTFNPGTGPNGTIVSIGLQADGKLLVGGKFTTSSGTNGIAIARLNADGSVDSTFNDGTGADGTVVSIAVQTDGKVVVGGFEVGTSKGLIARLNADGSLDSTFNPGTGADSEIWSVAVQADGKVVLGGHFTTISGIKRNYIARLNADGSLDTTFDPGTGADDLVWSVAVQADSKVLVGGDFGAINGVSQVYVARLLGGPLAVPPISLNIQKASNQVLVSWTNGAFSLQSAPFVIGTYTNVPGATSPYTNPITGSQQYFRLKVN